jgi:hypothetical protein
MAIVVINASCIFFLSSPYPGGIVMDNGDAVDLVSYFISCYMPNI